MGDKPILSAIRSLLAFRDSTTIAEIASIAAVPKRRVLDVINANGPLVHRHRDTGKITKVNPREMLIEKLRNDGAFYWFGQEDWGSTDTIEFKGHDDLRARLSEKRWGGGLGDCYAYTCILKTPENIEACRAAGMVERAELITDDRLWKEPADAP